MQDLDVVANAELLDERAVLFDVAVLDVLQQATTLTDELHEATASVVVLLVLLQVLGEVLDAVRHDGDLNLGGTGIAFALAVLGDEGLDSLFVDRTSGCSHCSTFLGTQGAIARPLRAAFACTPNAANPCRWCVETRPWVNATVAVYQTKRLYAGISQGILGQRDSPFDLLWSHGAKHHDIYTAQDGHAPLLAYSFNPYANIALPTRKAVAHVQRHHLRNDNSRSRTGKNRKDRLPELRTTHVKPRAQWLLQRRQTQAPLRHRSRRLRRKRSID